MVTKKQSVLLWIFAVLFTIGIAAYQRITGPTHPVKGKIEIKGKEYKYKLLRSFDGDKAPVKIAILDKNVKGVVKHRVYRSKAEWITQEMILEEGGIVAYLPHMPPAGKVEYKVFLTDGEKEYMIQETPTVLRYKGAVPAFILIPHIIFMFFAMLFSFRTGIEALFKGGRTYRYSTITIISLFLGGLILGPIVQKYAFGDFWTGWPFGGDWTDNKTIFAFAFWAIAWFVLRKKRENRIWPIIAAIVLFSMYMIPHSMGGSELDAETGKVTTGLKE